MVKNTPSCGNYLLLITLTFQTLFKVLNFTCKYFPYSLIGKYSEIDLGVWNLDILLCVLAAPSPVSVNNTMPQFVFQRFYGQILLSKTI